MSRHGIEKIDKQLKKIEQDGFQFGYMNFDFGVDTLNELELLDKYAFSKMENLFLQLSTNKNEYIITDEELIFVSKLKNVKYLYIYGTNNKSFEPLKNMQQLITFQSAHKKTLDINFLGNIIGLKELMLWGKIKNIEGIKNCINLKKIKLNIPLNAEEIYFLTEMKKLKEWFTKNRKGHIFRDEEYYKKNG